jgi:hypothetical protein
MNEGPTIGVEQVSVLASGVINVWAVEWTIANNCAGTISILSAQLPHGQFKSSEQRFEPPLKLDRGGQVAFRALVHCHEPPGLVTENAFIIFQVLWFDETWRLFVRIRVVIKPSGEPQTAVELITTQRAGFAAAN